MNYKSLLSDTVNNLEHSEIDRIFEMAARMEDVVVLAMGQPDFNTPDNVSLAAIKAICNKQTRYTDDLGIEELRKAISEYLDKKYGVKYNPVNEIIAFAGVSNAIDTALRALVNPGDEVIVHQPCYNSYVPCILLAGGKPVIIDTKEEEGFKLSPERLMAAISGKTKAIILSYPNNPTGACLNREELMAIRDVIDGKDIFVLSDEIYSETIYEGEFVSFASLPGMWEKTVTLNGVTKSCSMPGWRLGYACAPAEIVDAMLKVHQFNVINAPSISQHAAVEALRNCDGYVKETLGIYDKRRKYMYKRFRDMGLDCMEPKGAIYVFPSIKGTGLTSKEFCDRLLYEAKVAVVPGYEFGSCGEGYIRCSFTTPMENIEKAMDRIEKFIKSGGFNIA
ncbi:MAG: pyridoxal phosphate-dependent aminotransferase [Caulobacteraceae bacterium]